jgi:hypothetical protein
VTTAGPALSLPRGGTRQLDPADPELSATAACVTVWLIAMTNEQLETLASLTPSPQTQADLIVPKGRLPEELFTEVVPTDSAKLLLAGQRGMGKSTELRRFEDLLNKRGMLPIFLQFGAQESVSQSKLIYSMTDALSANRSAKLDDKAFQLFRTWYTQEEIVETVDEDCEGSAGVGGEFLILRAKGQIRHREGSTVKKTRIVFRSIGDLVDRFNELVEKARNACQKRIVFIVDDLDKVQDAHSIEQTFVDSPQTIARIVCPCVFTVPITYATSSSLRMATLGYSVHRVPAVDLFDESGKRNEASFDFMRRVFKLRMRFNPVPEELLDKVLEYSGGVLVDAMRMLRESCKRKILDETLAIDDALIEAVFQTLVDDHIFTFDRPDLWQKLGQLAVAKDKKVFRTDDKLPELLYRMILIEYCQKSIWFDLHPAARRLYEQNADVIQKMLAQK